MNTTLPPAPFYVLILGKTHMSKGFCVGGIAQNGRSVRLEDLKHFTATNPNHEYNIGDVWLIEEYNISKTRDAPHTEDIIVTCKKWVRKSEKLVETIEKFMPPVIGGIDGLYSGALILLPSRRLCVGRQNVPDHSTCFWRPNRDLQLVPIAAGKCCYAYPSDDGNCLMSYVGTENARSVLRAGTLVRLSLAHWFPRDKDVEQTCYLQVSGWFDEPGEVNAANHSDEASGYDSVDDRYDDGYDDNGSVTVRWPEIDNAMRVPSPATDQRLDQARLLEPLKRYFGFDQFRPLQQEIIESVLARRDTLVIMATGSGKSLCYQLPATLFDGLTVVISPLISLMQDQVAHLEQYGIAAATLNQNTPPDQRTLIESQVRSGQLKLLYLSPERLAIPHTIGLLKAGNVACLVIDEAHCISQWGHDFRKDYREIPYTWQALGKPPVLALTATATTEVRDDIAANLQLRNARVFVAPFNRPNLFLSVQPRHNGKKQVLDFLHAHAGQSGIIYCSTIKNTDELAEVLQQAGIHALPYHASLDRDTRDENQRRFVLEEGVVMVATVAFGMGIDKPDVRFVLHYNLPGDPESYYQQIGRAGRDGDHADCLLLHGPDDFNTIRYWFPRDDPERLAKATARLQHMIAWVKSFTCRRKWLLAYFGESNAPENCGMCDACVQVGDAPVEGGDDLTPYALLFLTCVKEVREKFGREHITNIICGSKSAKLHNWKHDKLPSYGQGSALTRKAWRELTSQFFQMGLVVTDDLGAIKLTPRGKAVMDGEKVYGHLKGNHAKTEATSTEYSSILFGNLRTLRQELAIERGLPAYMIVSDRSLREMAAQMPQTPHELLNIHGIGEHKVADFGEVFIAAIREHLDSNPFDDPSEPTLPKSPQKKSAVNERRESAFAGLRAGKSFYEVADDIGYQAVTVLRYVSNHLKQHGELPQGVVCPTAQVPSAIREQVFSLFDEHGTDALGPVYWAMEERVEYIDLDLLRIEFLLRPERPRSA